MRNRLYIVAKWCYAALANELALHLGRLITPLRRKDLLLLSTHLWCDLYGASSKGITITNTIARVCRPTKCDTIYAVYIHILGTLIKHVSSNPIFEFSSQSNRKQIMADTNGLVIAFFYESISLYRSRGYSEEDCVELDKQETIDAIAASIQSNGHRVVCVGDIKELVQRMAREEHKEWDLAFSISEGMHGVGREAQIPGLLEAYQIPHVFSDAATLALCLDKGKTKVR